MSDIKDEKNQQEGATNIVEPEVVSNEIGSVEPEVEESTFDLMDDFYCGELLLDADEDRGAFKLFLRVATDKKEDGQKRKAAIDKLLYIALKNSHNQNLLDNDTWKEIEKLSKKGKGYEYAYLLLHFRYYAMGVTDGNDKIALDYLKKYLDKLKNTENDISPIAYLQMGVCFAWGLGMKAEEISDKTAMAYYSKAAKKGCVASYRYMVSSYLFGGPEIKKNVGQAKKKFHEGIGHLKEKFEHGEKEVMPFFEKLVDCCFAGKWLGYKNEMEKEGKEWAQYMIDNGIKGGYSLMGKFFVSNSDEFNTTMAMNYFEEALKNNETSAYWGMAIVNYVENNYKRAYVMARKGAECRVNTFSILGQMYENQGDENWSDKNIARECYLKAWECYENSYSFFGSSSEDIGALYLDKKIKPAKYGLKKLEDALEHSVMTLRPKAIKCYLRLIQKINGKDYANINYKSVYELPEEYQKKYRKYLQLGADNPDEYDGDILIEYARLLMRENEVDREKWMKYIKKLEKVLEKNLDFNKEYVEFVCNNVDEQTKEKLFKKLIENSVYNVEYAEFVCNNADEKTKEKLFKELIENSVYYPECAEFVCNNADEKTKEKLFRRLMEYPILERERVEFVYNNADEKTKQELFEILLSYSLGSDLLKFVYKYADKRIKERLFEDLLKAPLLSGEQIEFVYEYADAKTKEELSKKLIEDSDNVSSKKQFVAIIENYNGPQDDSFMIWVNNSLYRLFVAENKEKLVLLANELVSAIEKSGNEDLKEQMKALRMLFTVEEGGEGGEEFREELLLSLMSHYLMSSEYHDPNGDTENLSDGVQLIGNVISAIENSNDEGLKRITEKYKIEVDDFIDSIAAEMSDETFELDENADD